MPIETNEGGSISVTGQGIETYRLIALKHALSLFERTGMRPNRHIHPLKIAQATTGVKGRNYAKMYVVLDQMIAASRVLDSGDAGLPRQTVKPPEQP